MEILSTLNLCEFLVKEEGEKMGYEIPTYFIIKKDDQGNYLGRFNWTNKGYNLDLPYSNSYGFKYHQYGNTYEFEPFDEKVGQLDPIHKLVHDTLTESLSDLVDIQYIKRVSV